MDNRANKTGRKRKRSVIKGLKDIDILQELETLAEKLGLEVRSEKGDFKSGFCTVNDQNLIILKKDELPERKIIVIAEKLAELEFEKHSPNPAIAEFITQIKTNRAMMTGPEED